MDKSKIKQFRLFKQNLPTHEPDPRYWYNTINTDNFSQFLNHINSSINFHHQDLNWDNTPTLEVVYDRLAFGSQCHLWMYEEKCLGWHWTNPNCVTLDWKSHYQDINDNEIYIGGALVSREYKPDRVLLTNGFNGLFLINCQSSWLIPNRNKFGSNEGEDCIAIISPV